MEAPEIPPSPSVMKTEPVESIERPHSPEINCSICLEKFRDRSYTDSCLHQFCFLCLKEWSKIKAECPLCKANFSTIIHNVRAINDYDEYRVETQEGLGLNRATSLYINVEFQRRNHSYSHIPQTRSRGLEDENYRRALNLLAPSHMLLFRGTNYLYSQGPGVRESTSSLSGFDYTLERNRNNRREIYRQNRWVRPLISTRFRQCSPEFYRLNPAQTHRLVPWISRDLHILTDVSVDICSVCQDILRLLTEHPIRSREFREAIWPVLGERCDHFIHELYNFAISLHDMPNYDAVAQYDPPGSRPSLLAGIENYSSASSDSDLEVVHILPKKEKNRDRGQTSGLDLTNRAGPSSAPTSEVVIQIDSDSSDEVEIINIPPKTPEIITIDDSSTSDSSSGVVCLTNGDGAEENRRCEPSGDISNDYVSHAMGGDIDAILEYENPARASPIDMPYLITKEETPASPSPSSEYSSSESRCPSPRSPNPRSSSSSSSSPSSSSSSSSSESSYCSIKQTVYSKRKPAGMNFTCRRGKKRLRKAGQNEEFDSSSDESYVPQTRPRLKSVVVKPEPDRGKRSCRGHPYYFQSDDSD